MKNQALTTTLAILLAVSLSALVALVVSSEVLNSQQADADAPSAITVEVTTPEAAVTQPDAPAAPAPTQATDTTDDESPTETPAPEPTPQSGNEEDAGNDDGEDAGNDAGNDDGDDDGDDVPVDPPCEGTVIDGECVPQVSILCLLGYELVDNTCEFVGCPLGYQLEDGVCEQLVFIAPCDEGFTRIGGECVPIFVIDPGVIVPLCPEGEHLVDGECVVEPKFDPTIFVPNLQLTVDG